ncbi:MAG: DUF962 domain-containing protein [bacterium]
MLKEYLDNYRQVHRHPVNQALHAVGIPTIVASLVVVFFNWKWGVGLFVGGWILQFLGHAFEGKPPAFFKNPKYLVIGPLWLAQKGMRKLRGKESPSS